MIAQSQLKTGITQSHSARGIGLRERAPQSPRHRLRLQLTRRCALTARPNETWSADFMADALWSGRRFRTFNVIDDFSREALRLEIDTSLGHQ